MQSVAHYPQPAFPLPKETQKGADRTRRETTKTKKFHILKKTIMEDIKSTYPSEEKLTSSTSIPVENRTDIAVTIENWTCGFGFLVDSVNLPARTNDKVKAEYVWYDFRAKDSANTVLAEAKGVYYNRKVILTQSTEGTYHLSTEKK